MENKNVTFGSDPVGEARGLAKFFSVDVTIKLFGHVIWSYHYPPQKN